jgi:hypothetical protein
MIRYSTFLMIFRTSCQLDAIAAHVIPIILSRAADLEQSVDMRTGGSLPGFYLTSSLRHGFELSSTGLRQGTDMFTAVSCRLS